MQANLDASFSLLCQVGDDFFRPRKISRDVTNTVRIPRSVLWELVIPYSLTPIYMKSVFFFNKSSFLLLVYIALPFLEQITSLPLQKTLCQ